MAPRIGNEPAPGDLPDGRQLLRAVLIAMAAAAVLLVAVILPAEYGIDPTGVGNALGLGKLRGEGKAIELKDNLAAGGKVDATQAGVAGEPLPLPNPAVHQLAPAAPATRTLTVHLDVGGEKEVKAVLRENQVVLYDWHTNGDMVYVDFHGHSPEWANKEAFVRYQESKEGSKGASGSLVAPFGGEHGWYWVNMATHPVDITVTLTGYFDAIKQYDLR